MLYRFYVGANNATGIIEREKLVAFLDDRFNGYTLIDAIGRWRGSAEPSVIVEVQGDLLDTEARATALAVDLARLLNQQAIGMQALPGIEFIDPEGRP